METINNHEPFQRLNPLNDYLFFKVMGEKGDEPQLLGFLNAVLGRPGKELIESVEIIEDTSFEKDTIAGKSCILDVLAVLHDGTKVNIEVQLSNERNMERRSLFYWSKVYYRSLKKGQDYRELPNVIAINIVDFDYLPGENFHACFHLREDADPSIILSPVLEVHFVNMVKWRRLREKDLAVPLHRWLTWFDKKSPPELIEEVLSMDTAIKKAYEVFGFANQEELYAWDLERRREKAHLDMVSRLNYAREEGEEIGRQIGEQKGQENKAIEIARKMKTAGRPCSEIEEFTSLPSDIIAKL
jgi:predicted transposase/invertase (TIGR01784 family)